MTSLKYLAWNWVGFLFAALLLFFSGGTAQNIHAYQPQSPPPGISGS